MSAEENTSLFGNEALSLPTGGIIYVSLVITFKPYPVQNTISEFVLNALFNIRSTIDGEKKSSESKKRTYSPFALEKPTFLAVPAFIFSC